MILVYFPFLKLLYVMISLCNSEEYKFKFYEYLMILIAYMSIRKCFAVSGVIIPDLIISELTSNKKVNEGKKFEIKMKTTRGIHNFLCQRDY